MNNAIYWLNLNLAFTALMWLPYILNRLFKQGFAAMGYDENLPPVSEWAVRAKKAHYNAVENLVVFAPAVLSFALINGSDFNVIKVAVVTYFIARVIHYVCYTFKVPYLRTLSFAAGWISTIYILVMICQLVG